MSKMNMASVFRELCFQKLSRWAVHVLWENEQNKKTNKTSLFHAKQILFHVDFVI